MHYGAEGDGDTGHDLAETRGHVIDILEESGKALVQQCYWDFGRWSDLWRTWRPVGNDRPFRDTPLGLAVRALHTCQCLKCRPKTATV